MENTSVRRPIDNSALIHLALHSRSHSNIFRLEAHLRSGIRPARLQQAADTVARCFPMLAAGIRRERNDFLVLPCPDLLNIRVDEHPLAFMSSEELQRCAMRVLYGRRHIAVEFFHSLTDGAGGLEFLRALLAEYLGVPWEPVPLREGWEDSYRKYAAGEASAIPGGRSYLFPPAPQDAPLFRTTLTFSVKELRARAAEDHTTLTSLFAALFAQTALNVQRSGSLSGKNLLPVQVMIPIDLRKRFPSRSLRNFSLYALPGLTPEAADASFPEIVEQITSQIRTQTVCSRLRSVITTNVDLEKATSLLPLQMKCAALRTGFEFCGGRSSCITVSNLGAVALPEGIRSELERLDFMLTPRVHSPYNCGIISLGDTLSLTITRRGADRGIEKAFVRCLIRQGILPSVVEGALPSVPA